MAELVWLRSRRHVLRRADVVRHDDDNVGHRQRPTLARDGTKGGRRSVVEQPSVDKREDKSHEGVVEALLGHLQQ